MTTTLDRESYDRIMDALEAAGCEPYGMPGRGVDGQDCVAVDAQDAMEFLMELAVSVCDNASGAEEASEILQALQRPSADARSASRCTVYWPLLAWQGDEDGLDGEDPHAVSRYAGHTTAPRT